MIDLARLVKLLNLTRSENDHEALAAIRMVNKMLAGKRWEDLLNPSSATPRANAAWNANFKSESFQEAMEKFVREMNKGFR